LHKWHSSSTSRSATTNFLIQQLWKSARQPDDGVGVARIVTRQKGIVVSDWKETNRLRELQEQIAIEKCIRARALRRLVPRWTNTVAACSPAAAKAYSRPRKMTLKLHAPCHTRLKSDHHRYQTFVGQ
jgi:hypothetical protein